MAYNIILQAMSTLRIDETKNEKKHYIKSNYFSVPGKLIGKHLYYSQLEPVSVMLIKQGIIPDMILSLCTKATIEKEQTFVLEEDMGNELTITPYEFYKSRVSALLPEDAPTKFVTVDIDESNINAGIVGAADEILAVKTRLEQENASDKSVKVWVNTQGGFRDISLVLNAIINLMSAYDIEIADIYSMPFGMQKDGSTPIESKMQNYQIFDFVVGMKEFLNYGRSDTLTKYYAFKASQNGHMQSQEAELVTTMKQVADAIQTCSPRRFNEGLRLLGKKINAYEESGAQFFDIFVEKVKEDYGILLSGTYTTINVVKWFHKKEFYQQALTYIEAFIPTELVKMGILSWTYDQEKVEHLKWLRKQTYVADANYLLFTFCNARTKDSYKMKKAFEANIRKKSFVVREKGESVTVTLQKPLADMNAKERTKLFAFIDSYYELKELRNQFNHMSEKEHRISIQKLSNKIMQFENQGKGLYKKYK